MQALVESPYFEKLERLYLGLLGLSQQEALRERFGDRVASKADSEPDLLSID